MMRRAAIAIPRVARRCVATMLIAFARVRYVANGSQAAVEASAGRARSNSDSRRARSRAGVRLRAMKRHQAGGFGLSEAKRKVALRRPLSSIW